MNPVIPVAVLIAIGAAIVFVAAGTERRARQTRRSDDVAGQFLASTGQTAAGVHQPLPRWLTALVALGALFGAGAFGVSVSTTASDAVRDRGADIGTCRSAFRARIDVANVTAGDIESQRIDLISDLVIGAAHDDPAAITEAAQGLEGIGPDVAAARATVMVQTDAYRAAVKLSSTDPDAFLRQCRADDE